jgi:hypothetical protein
MTKIACVMGVIAIGLAALPASAQTMRYPVKTVDFDIWCTEIEHIAWQRCDKREQEDLDKFETYRHTFERYEIPYLKSKDTTLRIDGDMLDGDSARPSESKPAETAKPVIAPPPDSSGK